MTPPMFSLIHLIALNTSSIGVSIARNALATTSPHTLPASPNAAVVVDALSIGANRSPNQDTAPSTHPPTASRTGMTVGLMTSHAGDNASLNALPSGAHPANTPSPKPQ